MFPFLTILVISVIVHLGSGDFIADEDSQDVTLPLKTLSPGASRQYTISVADGNFVNVTFIDFNVGETSAMCTPPYVELIETEDGVEYPVARYCGTDVPGPMVSETGLLKIRFHVGSSAIHAGSVHIQYHKVAQRQADCGDTIFETNISPVTVSLPRKELKAGRICTYRWVGTTRSIGVSLKFNSFSVGTARSKCSGSYVDLKEIANSTKTTVAQWCGSGIPGVIQSPTDVMELVIYTSSLKNSSIAANAISVQHSQASAAQSPCGSRQIETTMNASQLTIPSAQLTSGRMCTYTLTAPHGKRIQLTFSSFDVGMSSSECSASYMDVSQSVNSMQQPLAHVCGNSTPGTIISNSNTIQITLKVTSTANSTIESNAVTLEHKEVDKTEHVCGPIEVNSTKTAQSLQLPVAALSTGLICVYNFKAPSNHLIKLMNTTLDVGEKAESCVAPYVMVNDAGKDEKFEILKLCGNETTGQIISNSNMLELMIKHGSAFNAVVNEKAITLKHMAVPLIDAVCGETNYKLVTGIGRTINIPLQTMADVNKCVYTFEAAKDEKQFTVDFTKFHVGIKASPCRKPRVFLEKEVNSKKSQFKQFCGNLELMNFTQKAEKIIVTLDGDATVMKHAIQFIITSDTIPLKYQSHLMIVLIVFIYHVVE